MSLLLATSACAANLVLDGSSFETGYDGFSCFLAYSWVKHGLAGHAPRRGVIDSSTAAHGRHSLKLFFNPPFGRKGFSPWCTFRWVKVKEGQKYTLSLYAKGSRDGQQLTASVSDNWQGWGWSRFKLTKQWRRYSNQITMGKTEGSYAWVLIPFPEDGAAWVDAVQLEEGELTDYAPGRAVDLGLRCNHPTKHENLFFLGDEVTIRAAALNCRESRQRLTLHYSVEDYFGQTPYEGKLDLAVEPGTTAAAEIPLGQVRRGSYKATVRALDEEGKLLDFEELVFGVIKRRQAAEDIESQFGLHGFPHPVLEHCGVRWLRSYILAWPAIEPEEGRFSWPEERAEDRLFLQNLQEHKIGLLPVLQGTPPWARSATRTHGGWSKGQSKGATLPRLDAWSTYVAKSVSRYRGLSEHWEVMNEPTAWMNAEDYLPFLKASYEEAKKADPESRIVAGDTAWRDRPFLLDMARMGALEYIDVFCGHFYGVAQSGPPEVKIGRAGADAVVEWLRSVFQEHGRLDLPIWNTEEGTYVPPWYSKEIMPKSREPWHRVPNVHRQARDMVRSHLIELGSGIQKVFWFYELYSERGADARWIIRPEGMYAVEYDGAPRPALIAYSVMAEKLEGAKPFGRRTDLGDKVNCFVFSKGADSVATVWYWGDDAAGASLSLRADTRIRLSDMMGNPIRLEEDHAKVLRLDGNPIYIEGAAVSAATLMDSLTRAKTQGAANMVAP